MPNVTLLPHLGSATHHARNGMAQLACKGIQMVLEGKLPENLIPECFDLSKEIFSKG